MHAWLLAIRVPTLPAAVVPVLVGTATAVALGAFRLLPFLAAMATALLIQIGTNLANDYFDYVNGADTVHRLGPTRVTQSGLIAPPEVRRGMLITFGLAVLLGVYLVVVGGWPILLIGLFSILAGIVYTGGPWPIGYNGLGDLFVYIFFGLIAVAGTTYLHTGTFNLAALINALPIANLATAILVVNNLRDIATDREAGKRTLAVLLGRRGTQIEYLLLVAGSYPLLLLSWLLGAASVWFWLPVLTLPLAVPLIRIVWTQAGSPLNTALKGTARLHMIFGALFTVGVLL
jgi:1,4-dihydroxy-2-naphthoate octaprenyltransferase